MTELKKMYMQLGFSEVKSYIQSGNIVFRSEKKRNTLELEILLEKSIKQYFGHEVPVLIRTAKEWKKAIETNPFLRDGVDVDKLFITFLSQAPSSKLKEELTSIDFAPDRLKIIDKCAYLLCEIKYRDTKISHFLIEKKLKVKATTRNWKTIMKLKEMSCEL